MGFLYPRVKEFGGSSRDFLFKERKLFFFCVAVTERVQLFQEIKEHLSFLIIALSTIHESPWKNLYRRQENDFLAFEYQNQIFSDDWISI